MRSGHVSFHIQGQIMRCIFNGLNMHKYTKNKQPKKQPRTKVKQAWQIIGSASTPTSLGIDETSLSKKSKEKSPAQQTLKDEPLLKVNR